MLNAINLLHAELLEYSALAPHLNFVIAGTVYRRGQPVLPLSSRLLPEDQRHA